MSPEERIAVMESRGATVKINQRKDGSYRVAMAWKGSGRKFRMSIESNSKQAAVSYLYSEFVKLMQIFNREEKVKP